MKWIKLYLYWQDIAKKEGKKDLEAKEHMLFGYVDPLIKELKKSELIRRWNYTFQMSRDNPPQPEIYILLGIEGNGKKVKTTIRDYLVKEGLRENGDGQKEFTISEIKCEPPAPMVNFWGKENIDNFTKMKELSSMLAMKAMRNKLGENYSWHVGNNRPGHIWSNQLGFGPLGEFKIYRLLAKGYLREFIKRQGDEIPQYIEVIYSKVKEICYMLQNI